MSETIETMSVLRVIQDNQKTPGKSNLLKPKDKTFGSSLKENRLASKASKYSITE